MNEDVAPGPLYFLTMCLLVNMFDIVKNVALRCWFSSKPPAQEPVLQRKIPMTCQTLSRAGFKQPKCPRIAVSKNSGPRAVSLKKKQPLDLIFDDFGLGPRSEKNWDMTFLNEIARGREQFSDAWKDLLRKRFKNTTETCERISFWPKHNLLAQHADFCNGSPRRRLTMYFKFMLKNMLKRVLHACWKF